MTRKRILIVEDEILISLNMENQLKSYGFDVLPSVQTAEEAIEQAVSQSPDLILMDIILAGHMDGIEAALQIRMQADIPIIYITANADPATVSRARQTSPYGYLNKPVSERDLYTNIDSAINLHQAERKLRRSEKRLTRINDTMFSLGADSRNNVSQLVALLGELFEADMVSFKIPEGRGMRTQESWNCPKSDDNDSPFEGDICNDVFREGRKETTIFNDLQGTRYYYSDPRIAKYGLKTYIGHPVFGGGKPVGILCAMFKKDISPATEDIKLMGIIASTVGTEMERINTAESIRDSEERYRVISEMITDYVFKLSIRPTGEIVMDFLGDNYKTITGRQPADALSPEGWQNFMEADDYNIIMNALATALSTGEPGEVVSRSRTINGARRYIRTFYRPLRDETGVISRIIGGVKDITPQMVAENALKEKSAELEEAVRELRSTNEELQSTIKELESANENLAEREKWLESIFRASQTGIGLVSDRIFLEANAKLIELSGYSWDELNGRSTDMLYPSRKDFMDVGKEIKKQFADKQKAEVRTRWRRKDGTIINVIITSTPLDLNDWSKGYTFTVSELPG